jgi:hypothetical protein
METKPTTQPIIDIIPPDLEMPDGFQSLEWDRLPEGYSSWAEYWMRYFLNERERRKAKEAYIHQLELQMQQAREALAVKTYPGEWNAHRQPGRGGVR